MVYQAQSCYWLLGIGLLSLAVFETAAIAQITPDTSLGAEQSSVAPSLVKGTPADLIRGGAIRGSNLFHSFSQFNVGDGQRVYFANPVGIQNILSRVTGTDPSQIFGTLGVDGNANLFVLNPNGILFGSNAQLDVAGSFLGTTASSLKFPNGSEFSASNPQAPPLLTENIIPGLQYGTIQPGAAITSQAELSVNGELILVADRLDLQNLKSGSNLTLQAREEIRAREVKAERGAITVNSREGNIAFSTLDSSSFVGDGGAVTVITSRGDITIRFVSSCSAANFCFGATGGNAGSGGAVSLFTAEGDIEVDNIFTQSWGSSLLSSGKGGNVTLTTQNGSIIAPKIFTWSGGASNFSTASKDGGNIVLSASNGSIEVGQLFSYSDAKQASGNGGSINLSTTDGDIITAKDVTAPQILSSSAIAKGGAVSLSARGGSINLTKILIPIISYSNSITDGNGGPISFFATGDIKAPDLFSYALSGNAGSVNISSTNGNIELGSILASENNGDAGTIRIVAEQGRMTTRDLLALSLNGKGNDIELRAAGDIKVASVATTGMKGSGNITVSSGGDFAIGERNGTDQSSIVSSDTLGEGRGGDIWITARSINLLNGAQISASTQGSGDGGDIFLNVSNSIAVVGTLPEGVTLGLLIGIPNSLGVNVPEKSYFRTINLKDFGEVLSGQLSQLPSGVFTQTTEQSTGNAGSLMISTSKLMVRNGGAIAATTFETGNAGDININASSSINIDKGFILSGVGTKTLQSSPASSGVIEISTRSLSIANEGFIQASSLGNSRAGNINIQAENLQMRDRARLSASTEAGEGGNIRVNIKDSIILRRDSDIRASSQGPGNAGNIDLRAGQFILGVLSEDSDVIASARTGDGGRIYAKAVSILGFRQFIGVETQESDFVASSETGIDGTITIDARDPKNPELLPEQFAPPVPTQRCQQGSATTSQAVAKAEYFETGKGGLPPSPTGVLQGETVISRLATLEGNGQTDLSKVTINQQTQSANLSVTPTPIIEAQSWQRESNGTISLVATTPTTVFQPTAWGMNQCGTENSITPTFE